MPEIQEFPEVKEICSDIENASFRVKFRGYAAQDVDEFMDHLVERLQAMDEKVEELKRYETWLRVEVHAQVVERAQQEARKILAEAESKARAVVEAAHSEMMTKERSLADNVREYTQTWNEQKQALEQELEDLRQYMRSYRSQSVRVLEESLRALKAEQQKEETESQRYIMPSIDSSTLDIDKLLEEIKRRGH